LQDEFPERVENIRTIHFPDYWRTAHTRLDGQMHISNVAANTYSCAPYLVAAAAIAFTNTVSRSAIVLMYSARLANLVFYLALIYVALRILPVGRLGMFCLALMPMTLHQAASVSADSPTIASAFLFVAYVSYLAFDPRSTIISTRQLILAGALLVFASLCKFNLWFSLLVLLIPAARIGTMRKKLVAASATLAALLLVSALWQMVNRQNLAVFVAAKTAAGIFLGANIHFVVYHPVEFVSVLSRTWGSNASMYAREFVGALGWLTIDLPSWIVWCYIGFLLMAVSVDTGVRFSSAQRTVCAIVVCASMLSIFVFQWTTETPRLYFAQEILGTHRGLIHSVQGRYFIPFAPILLLLATNGKMRLKASIAVACGVALVLVAACVSLACIYGEYYRD